MVLEGKSRGPHLMRKQPEVLPGFAVVLRKNARLEPEIPSFLLPQFLLVQDEDGAAS